MTPLSVSKPPEAEQHDHIEGQAVTSRKMTILSRTKAEQCRSYGGSGRQWQNNDVPVGDMAVKGRKMRILSRTRLYRGDGRQEPKNEDPIEDQACKSLKLKVCGYIAPALIHP